MVRHPRFQGKENTQQVIDLIPETTYWGGAPSVWTHQLIERLAPLLEKEESFDYFIARLPADNPAFALAYLSRVGAHLERDSEAFPEILESIRNLEMDPNIVLGHLGLVLGNPQLKSRTLIEEALETILSSSASSFNQTLALTALLKNPSISQEQAQKISRNFMERSRVDPDLLLETLSILPRYQGEPSLPSETQEVAIAKAIDGAFSAPDVRMSRPLQFFEVLGEMGADPDKIGRALGHIAYNPKIKNALSLNMLLEYFFKRAVSLPVLNLALTEAVKNPHLPERIYRG